MQNTRQKSNPSALASLRKRMGLSQEQMALKLNVHRSTIKFVEQGKRTLPTNSLILLANLEIMMAANAHQVQYERPHPAEAGSMDIFRKKYEQLFARESFCRVEQCRLAGKLETMVSNYQKARERLKIIEAAILENDNNSDIQKMWKRQETIVANSLQSCGLPMQVLLRSRLAILNAEAEMYKSLKAQLQTELPACFLQNNP